MPNTGTDELHSEAEWDDVFVERDGQEEEPDGALVAEEAEGHALEDLVEAEREDDQETSNDSLDEGHKLGVRESFEIFRSFPAIPGVITFYQYPNIAI